MLTVKELKEFIHDLPDNTEVVLESVIMKDEAMCSEVCDITFHETFNPHIRRLVLIPSEVVVE